ncbi:MAG: tRNA uridine-5-carboxymethylaminomethyl(34) synthesis GTPase MnmE [Pseudomonadota bacterium]
MSNAGDTIYAKASGAGKAGVAVFRVSGVRARSVLESLAGEQTPPRITCLKILRDGHTGHTIDHGLVVLFPKPASYTGEDIVEFHLHGGHAVETALYDALRELDCRPAEPGEFTKRALLNGKMDIAQIEGLADLLDAETTRQHQQATAQYRGALSDKAAEWREGLIAALAPLEAAIDFPDEEGVPADIAARAAPAIKNLMSALETHAAAAHRASRLREGLSAAIIGAPNAGKSSLLNRLAQSDRAIVSDTPGTTRDVLDVRIDLSGVPVTLIDTAGLREHTGDAIEKEGMARAVKAAENADIRILVVDPFAEKNVSRETAAMVTDRDFVIWNKADLGASPNPAPAGAFSLSAETGVGVEAFLEALGRRVADLSDPDIDAPLTRERHVQAVHQSLEHLKSAEARLATLPELAAEDVRLAARALGRIAGNVDVEEVLGDIFSSFCIGK